MILGITPARGGSKGIPDKNLALFRGKPLVAHAIACVQQVSVIDAHIVSTNSGRIAEVARIHGGSVPFMRPDELAQDETPMMAVLKDVLMRYEKHTDCNVEAIVLVDPTAPLRVPNDLIQAVTMYSNTSCSAVISVSTPHRNPYFNMVMIRGGNCSLVCDSGHNISRRQDAPLVYDLNTVVWVYSRRAIIDQIRIPPDSLLYSVPIERCLDLDTKEDLERLRTYE